MSGPTPIRVPYGETHLEGSVPAEVQVLMPGSEAPRRPPRELVAEALDAPTGTPPLEELARGRRSAVILISCRTRRTGSPIFVEEIVRRLNAAGIPDQGITVITATGTHDNFRAQDAPLLVGEEIARRLRLQGHDCRTPGKLRLVGETSRGTRVELSTAYLEADLRIACGRVTFHYFAGFTGGRKAILPGVSSFDSTEHNHAMAVLRDGEISLHPDTRNGILDTNPIHLDMLEAARMCPPELTLSTVLNTEKEITHVFAGELEGPHLAAVEMVRRLDAPVVTREADLAVISSGGAPSDVNTIQCLKALFNNAHVVRRGGAVILCAQGAEGSPEWLLKATEIPALDRLRDWIGSGKLRKGHNALWNHRIRERSHVIFVTDLPDRDVERLGHRKARTLREALDLARAVSGRPRLTYVIPYGNVTVVNGGREPCPGSRTS